MILDKQVSEIMHSKIYTAECNTPVYDIACLMDKKNVGSVLIVEKDKVKGIITEADIVNQLYKGNHLTELKSCDIMTKKVISVAPDTTLGKAIDLLFENKFRRLPVVKKGKIMGILTSTDICYEINSPHASKTVGEIMRTDVVTTTSDKTIYEALDHMLKKKSSTGKRGVGGIVIVSTEGVEGILTERDIIRYVVAKKKDIQKTLVSDIMSTDMITIRPDIVICHAADLMSQYHFRHLPILDYDEKLVGIITQTTIIGELKREYEENLI
ncbi:MAG: CBS domain-containing protein [Candidatus Altiarchaeota archaeon]